MKKTNIVIGLSIVIVITITFIILYLNDNSFKDLTTLVSAIIVAIGWFINSELNRIAEIRKRRSEHRLTALKSVVENLILDMSKGIDQAFKKPDFKDKVENARATIQMYGYRNEINAYEDFIRALNIQVTNEDEAKDKLKKFNECIPKLNVIWESIRTELGLEVYKKKK